MDAETRAELSALRRRAYGPDADLDADPTALARLIELEDLARTAAPNPSAADPVAPRPVVPSPGAPDAPPPQSTAPNLTAVLPSEPPAVVPAPPRRRRMRRGPLIAAVTAAAAIVIAIVVTTPRPDAAPGSGPGAGATPAGTTPAAPNRAYGGDPYSTTLMIIDLDGSASAHVEWPAEGGGRPGFPPSVTIRWATDLGTYYGWHLWVAQGDQGAEDQYCIIIERSTDVRARCANAVDRQHGALGVSLTAADIDAAERPGNMSASESIGFWWLEQNRVHAVLGTFESR